MKRWMKWAIAAAVVIVLGVVVGPFVYINFIKEDAPERLSLDTPTATTVAPAEASTTPAPTTAAPTTAASGTTAADAGTATTAATPTTTPAAASGIAGPWVVTPESIVGYRVKEILFGQDTEGVGRTSAITGGLQVSGTAVESGEFSVDMATLESDDGRRDNQFRGRIMDVATYPTATFVLTAPIELGTEPADGARFTAEATGDLTLRGTTRPVTFPVEGERTGDTFRVLGNIPIVFADYGIPNPSSGPITTEDNGLLEFLLVLARG